MSLLVIKTALFIITFSETALFGCLFVYLFSAFPLLTLLELNYPAEPLGCWDSSAAFSLMFWGMETGRGFVEDTILVKMHHFHFTCALGFTFPWAGWGTCGERLGTAGKRNALSLSLSLSSMTSPPQSPPLWFPLFIYGDNFLLTIMEVVPDPPQPPTPDIQRLIFISLPNKCNQRNKPPRNKQMQTSCNLNQLCFRQTFIEDTMSIKYSKMYPWIKSDHYSASCLNSNVCLSWSCITKWCFIICIRLHWANQTLSVRTFPTGINYILSLWETIGDVCILS